MNSISSSIKRSPLVAFFILAFALEGIVTLLLMRDATTLPFALVLTPTVAAVTVAAISEGWTGVKALLGRLLRWRVGLQWYAVVLGVPVLGSLVIVGSAVLLGMSTADLFGRLFTPATLIVLAVVLLPAFLEELGWRGYALPRLLPGRTALSASLILGVLWAAFHWPLYLPGQMYDGLPIWPLPTYILACSVLLTWVFVNTKGSVLIAGLFHAALNGVTPITWGVDPLQAWELRAVVFAVFALFIVVIAGANLTLEERGQAALEGQAQVMAEPAAKA